MNPKSIIILGGGSTGLLAATYIKKYLPDASWKISVIASSKIPIIGVGEGTTEHIDAWRKTVGITHGEFATETLGTEKYGVRFLDWRYDGHEYVHALSCEVSLLHNPDLQSQYQFFNDRNLHWSMTEKEIMYGLCAYQENQLLSNPSYMEHKRGQIRLGSTSLQYHFNNFALNKFLRKLCNKFDIEIIDDEIVDLTFNENGTVKSLNSSSEKYEADFFFDCSGFKRFIISKMGATFKDYGDQLILDSALFFPDETEDVYIPYTLAQGMKSGWFWQAPTQDRTGNGYVFSSSHITADQALMELEQKFGKTIKPAGVHKFKSGHLDKSWIKNVCALGISSGFFEPLEAAAISTGVLQANLFCELITNYNSSDNFAQNYYNKKMKEVYDNSFEFIRLHYLNCREDTPFWKDYKNLKMPDELSEKIEMWKHRPPSEAEFPYRGFLLYGPYNFFQVMYGLDLCNSESLMNWFKYKGKEKNILDTLILYDIYLNRVDDEEKITTKEKLEIYRKSVE